MVHCALSGTRRQTSVAIPSAASDYLLYTHRRLEGVVTHIPLRNKILATDDHIYFGYPAEKSSETVFFARCS
jgi:hypothetical protein